MQNYLHLFIIIYLFACNVVAAPFTQSDKELSCDIFKNSLQLDDPEFPVTSEMVSAAYGVTKPKYEEDGKVIPEYRFIPVQIPDVAWFRHTPNTDLFYTSFGIVDPSKLKGKNGQYRDSVTWNANDELVNITGYHEHYILATNTLIWKKFEFTFLNGARWSVNGVLVTLTPKSLHARVNADLAECKID